ncbi:hypothetical protein C2G38_2186877 [Gigaspora rosea]|uniref:Uncharacterized protein n=1 Tax=Gigaspora rosea TaxID=44941 RepID=A0A397V5B2_9GLOM|nr:hypothetical protein C2G38_2186877 [Gigaspora rosea]
MIPNLQFQQHASDLCKVCTSFKAKLLVAKQNNDEYNKVQAEYNKHKEAANLKKQYYNNNIEESKNNLDVIHICYNWAQNIKYYICHNNVCKTGKQNCQLNFLIDENKLPEKVSNGANTTLNMKLEKFMFQKKSVWEEASFQLLQNNNFDKNEQLNTISSILLSRRRIPKLEGVNTADLLEVVNWIAHFLAKFRKNQREIAGRPKLVKSVGAYGKFWSRESSERVVK